MIAILGTGRVGGTLARALTNCGHDVVLGSRSPDKGKPAAEAVRAAGIVILATPFHAAQTALAVDLTGKILIDCTNPFAADRSGLTVELLGTLPMVKNGLTEFEFIPVSPYDRWSVLFA